MRDLIDRQAAIEELKSYIVDPDTAISENPDDVFQYNAGIRTAVGVIMELQTASPWHRVEEPPKDGQECIIAYSGPTDWIYEHATYHSDLNKALEEDVFIDGTDGFIVDGNVGYARHGLFKYWMPIEPPKEDA